MSAGYSIQVTIDRRVFRVHLGRAYHLAIPLDFDPAAQPNAFHLAAARQTPVRAEGFVGDTRLGGSANCADIRLNPHGNGTHTECVGHIVDEPVAVGELVTEPLIPALILSVPTTRLDATEETYEGIHEKDDQVLTARALRSAWHSLKTDAAVYADGFSTAVIVRTLPNSLDKKTRTHSGTNPPYPTTQAVDWLLEIGCEHLVLDLPSLDRETDGGTLPNHHRFFEVPPGEHRLSGAVSSRRTITEMAYIPDELPDAVGLLNLQLPRFALDAAPSRPLFYRLAAD